MLLVDTIPKSGYGGHNSLINRLRKTRLIDTVTGPVHTVDNHWFSDLDTLDWKPNGVRPRAFTFGVCWFLDGAGAPAEEASLAALPESGGRKIVLASLLRQKSCVSKDWNASCLTMGHPGSARRLIPAGRTDRNMAWKWTELAEILFAEENTPPIKSFNLNPRGPHTPG